MTDSANSTAVVDDDEPEAETSAGGKESETYDSEWLTPGAAASNNEATAVDDHLVIVIGAKGDVRSVIDLPDATDNLYPRDIANSHIDDIWPSDIAARIKDQCKRVLRSRQVRSSQLTSDKWQKHFEFTFVAQSRDSVMLIVRDISDTKNRIKQLEQLAFEDPVTGLPNREWLTLDLASTLENLRLRGGRAAIICLDIEQVDIVGGVFSQMHWNSVLRELALRMKSGLRGANQPDERDGERYSLVARVDAGRFAVILPNIQTGEDAASVTTRLVDMLGEPVTIDGVQSKTGVTAGIALYPQDGRSGEELFSSATTALQDAKTSQSTRQKFHSGTVRMRAIERQDLELELRTALDKDEFALAYLPIVSSKDLQAVTAEALLRWPKSIFGSKPISEVIAFAEFTGMILPIGEWIFQHACGQLAEWHSEGFADLRIAVNISAQEFSRGELVERTCKALELTGLPASSVIVEITERLLVRDSVNDYAVCRGLKEQGVSVSVDDYGVGICSFDHLSRSPVDSVKIHPDIVARTASNAASRAACAAVTAMAHALDITVVAEGVETEQQLAILGEIGCDFMQGFLFCKPASAEGFITYLRSGAAVEHGEGHE